MINGTNKNNSVRDDSGSEHEQEDELTVRVSNDIKDESIVRVDNKRWKKLGVEELGDGRG